MRIAFHVPRASFLGTGFSGDYVLVAGLVDGLRDQGHEVEIVSQLDARELGRRRVPAHRLVSEAVGVRRRMQRFAPEGWLVYMPSVTYPDLFGWWQRPARYVVFAADKGRPERLPRRWRALFAAAHRRSLLAADAVTVYRPRGAARIRSLGVEPGRVLLLPPAVAAPKSHPCREEARRTLGLPADVPVVLCVSRFTTRRKDGRPGKTAMIRDLLGAVAALPPPVVCVVVGGGPGQSDIEDERARLGLEERVRLAGYVPNRDVYLYYAACDVFAYPYDLDRPWVSVLEAQACGRPVVTMRTDSAELTVRDGRTGLLAKDLGEFRAQLASLIADRARCEWMGRAARDFTARFHTIGVRVGQIEALLSGESPR